MTDSSLPTATPSNARSCAECGGSMEGRGTRALYCSRKCNRRVVNRKHHPRRAFRVTAPCAVDDCQRNSRVKGLCHKHYEHQRIHGTVIPKVIVGDDKARLLSKLDMCAPVQKHNAHLGSCWIYTGLVNEQTGYGHFNRVGVPSLLVHRASYELFVGPIPDGLQIDHLCMVRTCVRPEHLEPVTAAENTRRARAAARARQS
jgi:hypothetical protein